MLRNLILLQIKMKVGNARLHNWRIGLTHDVDERRKHWTETEKLDTRQWESWQADSLTDAQDLEASFILEGMQGGTGGNLSPWKDVFVYVF
jgi:hypothetical protein